MKKIIKWLLLLIPLACIVIITLFSLRPKIETIDRMVVLVPERITVPFLLNAWQNAAQEDGFHLTIMKDKNFLYSAPITLENYPGVILPDTIHTQISTRLAEALKKYVYEGGQLMLVFDAATQDSKGKFFKTGAAFSDVLRINYGAKVNEDHPTINLGPIGNTTDVLESLWIPPGKCVLVENAATLKVPGFCGISSYGYGALTYSYFMNNVVAAQNSPMLLTTPDNAFVAGVRSYGKGNILFVNTPLSSLWAATDGMLLHSFLQYFGTKMLHVPRLSGVPNGMGGLVMNLHTESIDALLGFERLEAAGLFNQGPYSIDFTAGPDLDAPHDRKGLDVLHNPKTQQWMRYLANKGNAIGSDGGWLHNYFGLEVNDTNQATFQKYVTMNIDAIEKILGQKVLEYVSSVGNQPRWVTRYITQRGLIAYYFTGNTGSAPTRAAINSEMDSPQIWSFPLVPLGRYASLRDFGFANLPSEIVTQWFLKNTQFAAANHTVRLIYYHPTDINFFPQYIPSLKSWLVRAGELQQQGIFRWYSMVDIAKFLNLRRDVQWQLTKKRATQIIKATHPFSLKQQTWFIPKDRCEKPQWVEGIGTVREDDTQWIVTAGDVTRAKFWCTTISSKAVPPKTVETGQVQQ